MNAIEELHHKMIDESDRHLEIMEDLTDSEVGSYVKNVVDTTAIVLGAYLNPEAPGGVGMQVIKGMRGIQTIMTSGRTDQYSITAVPCINRELAVAAARIFGDGARPVNLLKADHG